MITKEDKNHFMPLAFILGLFVIVIYYFTQKSKFKKINRFGIKVVNLYTSQIKKLITLDE